MLVGSVDTLRAVASAAKVSNKTASDWKTEQDFPTDENGNYPLIDIGKWIQRRHDARLPKVVQQPIPVDENGMPAVGDSPGLERYRLAKATLAEMDVKVRENELVPLDQARAGITAVCLALRHGVESIQREFGVRAKKTLDDCLDNAERLISEMFPDVENEPTASS